MLNPLPRWSEDRFNVDPDADLLAKLTRDMEVRGGAMKPAPGWFLTPALVHGSMNDLLEPWIGAGLVPLAVQNHPTFGSYTARHLVPYYERYARGIDHADLLERRTIS